MGTSPTLYLLFRALLRACLSVFFRQIAVVGREHVPREGEGAVLFVGNHRNSLLDPALVVTHSGRIVHFAAADVLFRVPLLAPFLAGLGAVPIARRADHADQAVDNSATFAALHNVLASGRAVGIFPEGLSHEGAKLARLKTGAARVALGFAERHPGQRLRIVPVGLSYFHPKRFRSRVLLRFGPVLELDGELVAAAADDPKEGARHLTGKIEAALRALTVNADDCGTIRVLDCVRRLYQPPGISLEDRVELARRFNDIYPKVRELPEVRALMQRVGAYQDRLDAAGLSDEDLRRKLRRSEAPLRVLGHLVLVLGWGVLALPGVLIHAPVFVMAKLAGAGAGLTSRRDVIATTKMLAGLFVGLFVYSGATWLAFREAGFRGAAAAAVAIVLTGKACVRVFDRAAAFRRAGLTTVRLVMLGREVRALVAERDALERLVHAAVAQHRPAELVPLFGPAQLD